MQSLRESSSKLLKIWYSIEIQFKCTFLFEESAEKNPIYIFSEKRVFGSKQCGFNNVINVFVYDETIALQDRSSNLFFLF